MTDCLIETAVVDGNLDPRGKTKKQFHDEVLKYLRDIVQNKAPIAWNIDFRSGLLRQARRLRKNKKREEAVLYYATWIEHMLNSMVAAIFRRRKLPDDWIRDFIKESGLKAKYAFVIIILSDKRPSKQQAVSIREVADRRNQFVHYKWLYYQEEKGDELKKSYERALVQAEKIVRHLQEIEKRYVKHGLRRMPRRQWQQS